MELWIIRHGQTADNALRILAGHQPGKLSELGIQQAIKTGKYLGKKKLDEIYCSDLGRTRETLDNILLGFPNKDKLKIIYSDMLREKGAGVLEGKPLGTWKENADKEGLDIRQYKPEKGESWQDVYNRGDRFLSMLIDKYVTAKPVETDPDVKEKIVVEKPEKKVGEEERKIDFSVQGTGLSSAKTSAKPSKLGKDTTSKDKLPKIMIVTHGGFVMEFFNNVNYRKSKQKPIFLNDTKNCSVNILRVSQKPGSEEIVYDVVERNNVGHL